MGQRSNVNILIESQYATSYLMAILIFARSVNILDIFTVKLSMNLTLTVKIDQDKM